jgi:CheY-like chemotaxis protein
MPLPSDFKSGGKRILLLTSESEILIRTLESRSGAFEFRAAPSPFDAGLMLATYDPHLFIVELDAQGWDGLSLCRRIHETPQTAHIQLAALAREITVELLESAQDAGVLRCFTKPLDPREVRRLLRVLFPHASWAPSPCFASGET